MSANDFIAGVFGEAATALLKSVERRPEFAPFLLPRVVAAWVKSNPSFSGNIPGVLNSELALSKTESGYQGYLRHGAETFEIKDSSEYYVTALVLNSLGMSGLTKAEVNGAELNRLGIVVDSLLSKAIDSLVKVDLPGRTALPHPVQGPTGPVAPQKQPNRSQRAAPTAQTNLDATPAPKSKPKLPKKPRAAPQEQKPELIVQHNIHSEGLAHADELGGLAAPSLSISKKDHPNESFGNITLVAHPSMVDPKHGVPVFAADIYSPRHPRAKFEIHRKGYSKLKEGLEPHIKKLGGYSGDLEERIESGGAKEAFESGNVKPALAHWFLSEKGHKIPDFQKEASLTHGHVSGQPEMQEFWKQHGAGKQFQHGDEYHQKMSDAISRSLDSYAAATHGEDGPEAVQAAAKDFKEDFIHPETGLAFIGKADALGRDADKLSRGGKEIDTNKTKEHVLAQAEKHGPEFKRWAMEKLQQAEGFPYIPKRSYNTGKVRKLDYNLQNILKEVTSKVQGGEDFFHGLGHARSTGAKKFKTLEDIKGSAHKLVPPEQFEAEKKSSSDMFHDLAKEFGAHHAGNGFQVPEALAEAIHHSFKRGKSLSSELRESGFSDVPPELVSKASKFARQLADMPTEYFEAKPQRIVKFNEFHGAAVPHDVDEDTLRILSKHGINHVEKYGDPESGHPSRAEAIRRIAEGKKLMLSEKVPHNAIVLSKHEAQGQCKLCGGAQLAKGELKGCICIEDVLPNFEVRERLTDLVLIPGSNVTQEEIVAVRKTLIG